MKKVIDLSENNGFVDFAKVKASGINDVILRVGWIGNKNNHTLDTRFTEYYEEAKKNGFNIGIYVFSYCQSVRALKSGAEWTLKQLHGKNINLPIFLDLEDDSNSVTKISICGKENLTEQAIEFCNYFKNLGYEAGVYASKYWFEQFVDVYQLLEHDYKIWLAEWNGKENHSVTYKVDLWQYTSNGKIEGISGRVDESKCLCECDKIDVGEITGEIPQNGDDVEVKIYKNGSKPEPVYGDTNLSIRVGTVNAWEQCDCLGIFENRAIVRYKVDNKQNYKIGFVKWLGGVK